MDPSTYIGIGALMLTVISAVWTQGLWISRQFSVLKDFVNTKVDGVTDKLQYHERHDDQRFTDLNNNLWAVRLENAQNQRRQGQIAPYTKNPRSHVRGETFPPDESGS